MVSLLRLIDHCLANYVIKFRVHSQLRHSSRYETKRRFDSKERGEGSAVDAACKCIITPLYDIDALNDALLCTQSGWTVANLQPGDSEHDLKEYLREVGLHGVYMQL
jgi:hypothetical protein